MAARDVTRRLQVLARGGDGSRTQVAARALLEGAAELAGAASTAEITIDVAEGTDAVWVDSAQMGQVFCDLVRNALEALSPAPRRPRVQLRAANAALPDGRISGLTAGDYVVKVQGSNAVFTNQDTAKTFTAPVKIENVSQKFDETAVDVNTAGGQNIVQDIQLGGTTTKLDFGY